MTKDPYKTLGVSPGASEQEIKSAYRNLVKKYHPDNYKNNPLEDLAKEKMQEINEAYDAINSGKAGQGGYTGNNTGAGFGDQRQWQEWQRNWQQQRYNPENGYNHRDSKGPYYDSGGCFTGSLCQTLGCLCCADACCGCLGGDSCRCC